MARGSVAEIPLSALEGHYHSGTFGAADMSPGVMLSERRGLVILRLAAPRADEDFTERVRAETGFVLPAAPNRTALTAAGTALWSGPGEWLLMTSDRSQTNHELALRRCLAGSSGAVVDLSQARAVICIAGEHSRDLLAMGCPLDLHHRDFAAGCCAQSLLGQVNVLLHLCQEADAFDLFVARSYALSVWDWLTDAAAGFGYRVLPASPAGTNGAGV